MRIADLNRDGKNDIILNSGDGTTDLAWYSSTNPKNGIWEKHLIQADVVGGHSLSIGDIDGDGDPDILSAEMLAEVAVYLNNGNGSFIKQTIPAAGAHNAVLVI
ncbi:MAG: FG-GAP-like repeat-containing protein [Desulfocapsaceae bacterium]|nr:FG-GAP-like repeat-containing protein [Desulfocapsaceae bacterium]